MSTTIALTSALESVKYLNPWISQQENIVKPEGLYRHLPLWQGWTVLREQILEEALLQVDLTSLIPYERSHPYRTADVTSQIEAVLSWLLSKRIMIPQPAEVRDYLLRYPDMTNLLPSVCKMAWEQFGMDTQLSLEVYHDPEIEDEYLTLYIRQQHYEEHILDIIEDICTQYEAELTGRSGWLLVTTDFRSPR